MVPKSHTHKNATVYYTLMMLLCFLLISVENHIKSVIGKLSVLWFSYTLQGTVNASGHFDIYMV